MRLDSSYSVSVPWQYSYGPDPVLEGIQQESTLWDKIVDRFRHKSPLRTSIEWQADSETKPCVSDVVDAVCSSEHHILRAPLRKIIKRFSCEELGLLFEKLVQRGLEGQGLEGLEHAVSLLSTDEIEKMFEKGIAEGKMSPQDTVQAFATCEKEYRKLLTSSKQSFGVQHGNTFIKMVKNFLDGLLLSFHITDIGKEVLSSRDASEKMQAYTRIIGFPLLLFTAICAFCAPLVALAVTAAILGTLMLSSWIYVTWFQGSPDNIEGCVNLLELAKQGALSPVLAREAQIDEALQCLAAAGEGHRAHPLLLGPSGVGKTEIVRGIAQRLALGNVPDALKGKKLLAINTADLLDRSGKMFGEDTLQRILNTMGDKKDDYIVFFDELHNAFSKNANIGERLKTIFDTNPNGLRYCIGATTSDEYEKHIATDLAFSRRFQKVHVDPTTKKQTVMILRETCNHDAPEIAISDSTLEKIYDVANSKLSHMSQPAGAKHVLAKAVNCVQRHFVPELQKMQQKLANACSLLHSMPDDTERAKTVQKISKFQRKIEALKQEQAQAQEKSQVLNRMVRFRIEQVESLFSSAIQAADHSCEQSRRRFLFLNYFVVPCIKAKIHSYNNENKSTAPIQIDDHLVDSLFSQ